MNLPNKDLYAKETSKKKVRSDLKAMLSRRGRNIQSIQSGSGKPGPSPAMESSSSVVYANLKESQANSIGAHRAVDKFYPTPNVSHLKNRKLQIADDISE